MNELIVIEKEELKNLIAETVRIELQRQREQNVPQNNQPYNAQAELLTMREAAKMLGMSYDTLKKNMEAGLIQLTPVFLHEKSRAKYARSEVQQLIENLQTQNERRIAGGQL